MALGRWAQASLARHVVRFLLPSRGLLSCGCLWSRLWFTLSYKPNIRSLSPTIGFVCFLMSTSTSSNLWHVGTRVQSCSVDVSVELPCSHAAPYHLKPLLKALASVRNHSTFVHPSAEIHLYFYFPCYISIVFENFRHVQHTFYVLFHAGFTSIHQILAPVHLA